MSKGNLLIVDDEQMIVERISMLLEDVADNVYTAFNGIEALAVLKEQEVHCIICDINMPKMNGVEVLKRIRAQKNSVPFIFYTAHGSEELMREAIKYGAFDFLSKPNLAGLEEVIKKGLSEGFEGTNKNSEDVESAFLSDYQRMLKEHD